jgi:nucleoside-diphosphate-sugar epimerase
MARHAFIVGGTGQIGRAVAAQLLDHGWRVTLSSRGVRPRADDLTARGATIATVDREQPGALAMALAEGADAVVDTIAYTDVHADQLLAMEGDIGSLVVISSSSVYRDAAGRSLDNAEQRGFPDFPEPIKETQPTVDPGPDTYSTRKVALERRLLDRSKRPITIVRPGAIHGSHSNHPREWWFVKRMLDGRKVIPLAYRGRSLFHTSAVANIARLVHAALDHPGTRILNAADPVAPTVAEIGASIANQLDYRGTILPIDHGDEKGNAAVGWSPWSVPKPFVLSTEAAMALGCRPATTYEASIAETCDWLVAECEADWKQRFPVLAGYPLELFDYAGEDEFLETRPLSKF